MKFSGTKESLKITPGVDLTNKSFTIWIRCKYDRLNPETKEGPLFSGGHPGDQTGVRGGFREGKAYFSVWGARNLDGRSKIKPGQWVNLAFVLDGKYVPKQTGPDGADLQPAYWTARNRLYVDGKLDADEESKMYRGELTRLGAFWDDGRTLDGVIQEVKVYPAALTAAEIQKLDKPGEVAGQPVLWVRFDK